MPLLFPTRAPQLPGGAGVKEFACQYRRCRRHGFDHWFGKIPWRRKCQHSPVFSAGESHRQGSLAGYTDHRVTKSRTQLNKHTKRSKRDKTSKRCWLCIYWGHRMKTSSEYTALSPRETSSLYSIVTQLEWLCMSCSGCTEHRRGGLEAHCRIGFSTECSGKLMAGSLSLVPPGKITTCHTGPHRGLTQDKVNKQGQGTGFVVSRVWGDLWLSQEDMTGLFE